MNNRKKLKKKIKINKDKTLVLDSYYLLHYLIEETNTTSSKQDVYNQILFSKVRRILKKEIYKKYASYPDKDLELVTVSKTTYPLKYRNSPSTLEFAYNYLMLIIDSSVGYESFPANNYEHALPNLFGAKNLIKDTVYTMMKAMPEKYDSKYDQETSIPKKITITKDMYYDYSLIKYISDFKKNNASHYSRAKKQENVEIKLGKYEFADDVLTIYQKEQMEKAFKLPKSIIDMYSFTELKQVIADSSVPNNSIKDIIKFTNHIKSNINRIMEQKYGYHRWLKEDYLSRNKDNKEFLLNYLELYKEHKINIIVEKSLPKNINIKSNKEKNINKIKFLIAFEDELLKTNTNRLKNKEQIKYIINLSNSLKSNLILETFNITEGMLKEIPLEFIDKKLKARLGKQYIDSNEFTKTFSLISNLFIEEINKNESKVISEKSALTLIKDVSILAKNSLIDPKEKKKNNDAALKKEKQPKQNVQQTTPIKKSVKEVNPIDPERDFFIENWQKYPGFLGIVEVDVKGVGRRPAYLFENGVKFSSSFLKCGFWAEKEDMYSEFSLSAAYNHYLTLTNCTDCTDCTNSSNLKNCVNVTNSRDCTYGKYLDNCTNCDSCEDSNNLTDCTKVIDSTNSTNCEYSSYLTDCTYVKKSEHCTNCHDSIDLKKCTNVKKSEHCTNCHDCTYLKGSKDSDNCHNSSDLDSCEDCTDCHNSTKLTNCSGCTNCRNSTKLTNCRECGDCFDCSSCTYCRDCEHLDNEHNEYKERYYVEER